MSLIAYFLHSCLCRRRHKTAYIAELNLKFSRRFLRLNAPAEMRKSVKFVHISDLHIGKRVGEVSMIEDQQYILEQIIEIIRSENAGAVVISGDVYDRNVPSAEAVALCDTFFTKLTALQIPVLVISGNHDSAERLAYGSSIFSNMQLYISPVFDGKVQRVKLQDEYGDINFYMLPFIKPAMVRRFYPDNEIDSYTEAVRTVLEGIDVDSGSRNVLAAHQFVTGALRSDSEEIVVGGLDNVDACVFSSFDYVALGHLHNPQNIDGGRIRYCGTPLKYSFSEAGHNKSVTIVELRQKGDLTVSEVLLVPLHDMRNIKGFYKDITARENYISDKLDDYIHVTLTDEEDIPDAIGKLRSIYPNILKLDYDNKRTRANRELEVCEDVKQKSPYELFEEFYEIQNGQPLNPEQRKLIQELIENIWDDCL